MPANNIDDQELEKNAQEMQTTILLEMIQKDPSCEQDRSIIEQVQKKNLN